jgi:pilus assembly protein CpaB
MDRRDAASAWRRLCGSLAARRRLVVAVLVGIAVLSGLQALRPTPTATRRVWVAAHDLRGGEPLGRADLHLEALPATDVPAGALVADTAIIGRLLAAPMRRGEPFTDVRILTASLLAAGGAPGDVAVPVRVADGAATLALVHAGEHVDVIAAPDADSGTPSTAVTVVHDVLVLATPSHDAAAAGGESADVAGLVVLETTSGQAALLARAAGTAQLSIAVRRGP